MEVKCPDFMPVLGTFVCIEVTYNSSFRYLLVVGFVRDSMMLLLGFKVGVSALYMVYVFQLWLEGRAVIGEHKPVFTRSTKHNL